MTKPGDPPCIGRNIQRLRKQQQLTLGMLAERSGVSKAMLSQIEADKVNPTVATVWKIAGGLEVELDALLKGGPETRKFTVTRSDRIATIGGADEGPHIRVLSPLAMAEDLEIYLLNFDPGSVLRSNPHAHGTEEYLTVLRGQVRVSTGQKTAELEEGDFIIYNCDVNHSIENTGSAEAAVHMIVRFIRRQWE